MAMTHQQALEVLAQHRGERIAIATMASIGFWPQLSDRPLDFAYMPSAMGQGPALALGLALAQPQRGALGRELPHLRGEPGELAVVVGPFRTERLGENFTRQEPDG